MWAELYATYDSEELYRDSFLFLMICTRDCIFSELCVDDFSYYPFKLVIAFLLVSPLFSPDFYQFLLITISSYNGVSNFLLPAFSIAYNIYDMQHRI